MKGRVPTGFSIETMSVCCVISWIMLSVLVFAPGCSASLDEGRALLKDIASFLFRKILPIAQDVFIESDISSECSGSLLKFMSAIRRSEPWALKMLTAAGLVPSGIMYLTMTSLGSYGQCLSTRAYEENDNTSSPLLFMGQYCGLNVMPSREAYDTLLEYVDKLGDIQRKSVPPLIYDQDSLYRPGLRLGLCVPSLCSAEEMNIIVKKVASRYDQFADILSCHNDETDAHKDPVYYVAIFVPCVLTFIMIMSTLLDIRGLNSRPWVKVFSAIRNHRKLVTTNPNQMTFLHGLKALLAYWIVLGHCYLLLDPYVIFTVKEALDVTTTIFFQIAATGAFLGVSVFFVSSGFIMSFTYVAKDKHWKTTHLRFYIISIIRRYYRLMLPALVVLVVALALPYIVHGPLTDTHFRMFTNCKDSWYKVPLVLVNTDAINHMCLSHLWYISADYQIVLMILPIMIFYPSYPRLMTALIVAIFCLTGIAIAIVTYLLQLLPFMGFNINQTELIRVSKYVYFLPTTHIGMVGAGILTGFLAQRHKNLKIPSYVTRPIWALTLGSSLVVSILPVLWYRNTDIPPWGDALYAGLHRHVYSVFSAWLIFACATGNANNLSSLLSSTPLVFLGKLSYAIYLVHYPILIYFLGTNATAQQALHTRMVRDSLGVYLLSAGVAYVLHLCVEAPVIAGDALFFKRHTESPHEVGHHDDKDNGLKDSKEYKEIDLKQAYKLY